MTEQPSADDAARALRNVDQRRDQALDSLRGARWVGAVFGVAIFLDLASIDFLPPAESAWSNGGLAVLAVGYAALQRTPRGAALLGRRARLDKRAVPPRFALGAWLVIIVLCVASVAAGLFHVHVPIPYLHTIVGAVLAIALILFGQQLNNGLIALAKRSR
jgi:putative copper export protein